MGAVGSTGCNGFTRTVWVDRVGVIGDLVSPYPLNYWSEIQLVVWDMDRRSDTDIYKALAAVSKEPEICLLDAEKDYLTVDEREAIEQGLRVI